MNQVVQFNNQSYTLTSEETLLQCLLRHGIDYPNSCQIGVCQSCLIKAKDGEIQSAWQAGLPETLKSQGYFLACLATPTTELHVSPPHQVECEVEAQIMSLDWLNYNVLQVKLQVESLEIWTPGQYVSFVNPEGTIRSYSIANIPAHDGYIELHIKILSTGSMGKWLRHKATKNTTVHLRGPFGHCYYHNVEQLPFDIVLAGTGTGLAPLVAIVKSAINQNHQGKITLVHGGVCDDDIYYRHEIEALALLNKSFTYDPCVLKSDGRFPESAIEKRILENINNPNQTRAYVCGPKETANKLKTQLFLAGIASRWISCDLFL